MGALLLYDADCGFCTRSARLVARLGLRAEVRPFQALDLDALGVSRSRAEREIPFVSATGEVSYGHLAIARVLATGALPLRGVGRLITVWPISTVAQAIYTLVAANRHRLPGGTAACAVAPIPSAE